MADTLGNTFTNAFEYPSNDSTYYDLSTSDWVATDLLDADTGDNFTSWEQLFGPHSYNGDSFTTVVCLGWVSFLVVDSLIMDL